jgi:hypothetical protein
MSSDNPLVFMGGMVLFVILLIGAGAIIAWFCTYETDKHACARFHELTGIQVDFNWSNGCYVRSSDGQWLTLTAYQNILTWKEQVKP